VASLSPSLRPRRSNPTVRRLLLLRLPRAPRHPRHSPSRSPSPRRWSSLSPCPWITSRTSPAICSPPATPRTTYPTSCPPNRCPSRKGTGGHGGGGGCWSLVNTLSCNSYITSNGQVRAAYSAFLFLLRQMVASMAGSTRVSRRPNTFHSQVTSLDSGVKRERKRKGASRCSAFF